MIRQTHGNPEFRRLREEVHVILRPAWSPESLSKNKTKQQKQTKPTFSVK